MYTLMHSGLKLILEIIPGEQLDVQIYPIIYNIYDLKTLRK
jgi:hypothetical protein